MTNESRLNEVSEFNITPDRITKIGLSIRSGLPTCVFNKGEFLNAIFESMAIQHNLPWDDKFGTPDWDDPRVQKLHREFSECLKENEKQEIVEGIEARCATKGCSWKTTGLAMVVKVDRILLECELTDHCRKHHDKTQITLQHNRFILFKDDKQVGRASVSSQACTGYLET